jgi:hypothetical protein
MQFNAESSLQMAILLISSKIKVAKLMRLLPELFSNRLFLLWIIAMLLE